MANAIVYKAAGGVDVMSMQEVAEPVIGNDDILIKNIAVEVSYIDIYQREGKYNLADPNKIPGTSGVGIIEKIGQNVTGFTVGSRIGYALANGGTYSTHKVINKHFCFGIPAEVSDQEAAAIITKGLTAHMLCYSTFRIYAGCKLLIHSVASGVGNLLLQFAKQAGVTVYGTVGSDSKIEFAKTLGCDYVINSRSESTIQKVSEYSNKLGVNAIFDNTGATALEDNLTMLMYFGILVNYGSFSGTIGKIDSGKLAAKSLFFTRPSIYHYKSNRMQLILTMNELFNRVIRKELKVTIDSTYSLQDAALAHSRLESRESIGSIILMVS
jgi:NADPH2:quinone reductase